MRSSVLQLVFIVGVTALGCKKESNPPLPNHLLSTEIHRLKSSLDNKNGDACGFTKKVALVKMKSGQMMVPPSHPYIRYVGRIDCSDPAGLRMSHPGAQIQVWFEGASLEMVLDDFGHKLYPNFYTVEIDDKSVELAVSPKKKRYLLADGLTPGMHTVTVFKNTETCAAGYRNNGKSVFKGFILPHDGLLHPPPPLRHPVMEFIGDSITCGYGNEVATMSPEHYPYSTENSNAYLAYGAIASRMLEGTYMPVAYSGRGVIRNWAGFQDKTLPEMYLDILPDDPNPGRWDVNRVVPDIVVVNLGTNDFSPGLNPEALPQFRAQFEQEYDLFVQTLRRYYPDALIILAMGPMLSDEHPPNVKARTSVKNTLMRLVKKRQKAGDTQVQMLVHSGQKPPFGEDWHPTLKRHQIMAEELVSFISSLNK